MKRLAVFAAVIAVFSAAAAFGAVQDFGKFTIDVAAGWTASQQDSTVLINKDDNTAAMSLTVDSAQGSSAKDLAAAFVENFKGSFAKVSEPEADADGDYSWDMTNANGVDTHAMLTVQDGDYMLITMTGVEAAGEEISAMLGSIQDK